jgi:hypothetical protein
VSELLESLRTRQPLPTAHQRLDALTHYTDQATLAGDANQLAGLISRTAYTPAELALLTAAIANKTANWHSATKWLDMATDALEAL